MQSNQRVHSVVFLKNTIALSWVDPWLLRDAEAS